MDQDIILLYQMQYVAMRCIWAGECYSVLAGEQENVLWAQTKHFYAEVAIVRWCQLFGAPEEKTHYTKLFGGAGIDRLKWLSPDLDTAVIENRLLKCNNLTEDEYHHYWSRMKEFRESYVSRWDLDQNGFQIPDLRIAVTMCREYIEILKSVCALTAQKLHDIHDIMAHKQADLAKHLGPDRERLRRAAAAMEVATDLGDAPSPA